MRKEGAETGTTHFRAPVTTAQSADTPEACASTNASRRSWNVRFALPKKNEEEGSLL